MSKFATFGRYVDRCESPIERRFLVALLFSETFSFRPVVGRGPTEIAEDGEGITLGQQVRVGEARVDFAMKRTGAARRIAIELDGWMFHSSREQIEKDKLRDRVLLAYGWSTVRFTGKEIIQDALGCARQAYEIAGRLAIIEGGPTLARGRQLVLAAGQTPLLPATTARTG